MRITELHAFHLTAMSPHAEPAPSTASGHAPCAEVPAFSEDAFMDRNDNFGDAGLGSGAAGGSTGGGTGGFGSSGAYDSTGSTGSGTSGFGAAGSTGGTSGA